MINTIFCHVDAGSITHGFPQRDFALSQKTLTCDSSFLEMTKDVRIVYLKTSSYVSVLQSCLRQMRKQEHFYWKCSCYLNWKPHPSGSRKRFRFSLKKSIVCRQLVYFRKVFTPYSIFHIPQKNKACC